MRKIIYIAFLLPFFLRSQNIDSLKLVLQNAGHDTIRCNALTIIIENEDDDNVWPVYNEQLKSIAEKNLAKSEELKNTYLKHLAYALNNIGFLANSKGNIPKSLDYFRRSLFIQEKINDKKGIAESLNNIGAIYKSQGSIKKALEHYQKGLLINEELGNKEGIGTALNNIAGIYDSRGEVEKALEYYKRCLLIAEELGDKGSIALANNNIGYVYNRMGEIDKSLACFLKGLKVQKEIEDKPGMVNSLSNIAYLMAEHGKANRALGYALKALEISKELGFPESVKNSAQALKRVYQKQNRYKEAIEMYELEIKMRDSIRNDETQKAAIRNQIQYDFEKKEAVAKEEHRFELEKQQAIATLKERKQNIIIWSVVMGLILVIGFAGYVFKTLNVTRKQKLVIEIKSREVEEKQKEILDSIYYARKIQRALVPSERYIRKNLERLNKAKA